MRVFIAGVIVVVVSWLGIEFGLVKLSSFLRVFGSLIFWVVRYFWRWVVIFGLFCNVGK